MVVILSEWRSTVDTCVCACVCAYVCMCVHQYVYIVVLLVYNNYIRWGTWEYTGL